jgi:hypothetical protein
MTTKITEQNISELANAGVNWQSVFTGDGSTGLTAVAGRGYFIDTTSGTVTVTLPASPSAGDVVVLKDYARTWGTNAVSLASTLMDGSTTTTEFSTQGQTVTLVYMDGTKGWSLVNEDTTSQLLVPPTFIAATGGTVTTSGDYKIHTFTGDGCFVVSSVGNAPISPTGGPDGVDYLVVAGGGGGGGAQNYAYPRGSGGGGAGGVRLSATTFCNTGPSSPRSACVPALTITATTYPVTVGGGGTAGPQCNPSPPAGPGSNSVFSTITSAGGGGGSGHNNTSFAGIPGGSGSSGANTAAGGTGNTPPVNPPQGSNGGNGGASADNFAGGGGGGFMAVGTNGNPTGKGGCGGAGGGVPSAFGTSGVPSGGQYYFGGGGAGGWGNSYGSVPVNCGGIGGGGRGGVGGGAVAGTANTGGAGGANGSDIGGDPGKEPGTTGGKGIVIVRYKFQ